MWFVYILKCADNSFYKTGIDLVRFGAIVSC